MLKALNKRIQTAKATLNFKEWEKDDKWSQEFLKHQEKRRYALQQELRRAQVSPQAVLRSKPLKSLHPRHAKSAALEMEENLELDRTKTDVARALSSRDLLRRGSKDRVVLGSRGGSDTTVQRASAANHRRIVELRKKKPSSPGLADCVEPSSTDLDPVYTTKAPAEQTAFIPDNEIVTVRFTFSRGRSRGTDNNTSALEQTDQPSPLEVDGSDGDMMSLSGAFSPGVELESALNDAVESCDHPRSPSKTADDPDLHDNNNSHDEAAHLAEIDVNTPQELATRAGDSLDEKKAIQNIPEEMVAASRGESNIHTQSDDEEDESYGDIFDDEALPSARASQQQHDRLEASGYASEFEDDVAPNVIPTAGQDGPVSPDEANEEEYFHDDFE
ncbi:hypothetical protein V7S43_006983 [Phytophthora oleae]|uniref:Uncharacterized protein n=1 Tax=Phytophthora oleae TaxID=2107226 RepID=A0ABD3FQU1_9STRA